MKRGREENSTSNLKFKKINPKINDEIFQGVEEEMLKWTTIEEENRQQRKQKERWSWSNEKYSDELFKKKQDEFNAFEKVNFEKLYREKEMKLYQEVSTEITALDIWEFKMTEKLSHLKEFSSISWKKLFKHYQLPFGHEKNSTFVLALLIVEEFISNKEAAGFFRKHDDGFESKSKEDNLDIIEHFHQKLPSIKIGIGDSYGWSFKKEGVDEIYINDMFYDKKMEISDEKKIRMTSFLLAITILHELCHFKIRNYQKKNIKDSPPKFNESGNYFEKSLFHGKLAHIGLKFDIQKLIIIPTSPKALKRELKWEHFEKWFDKDFWESISISKLSFDLKRLPTYKREDGDLMEKEVLLAYNGMDAIDYLKCGTYFPNSYSKKY